MPKLRVYTRDGCSRCAHVKRSLTESAISFEEFMIGRDVTREEVLAKFPDRKQLPIVVDRHDQIVEMK